MSENSINIMVPFSTVRFEQKEQIDAAVSGALKTLVEACCQMLP